MFWAPAVYQALLCAQHRVSLAFRLRESGSLPWVFWFRNPSSSLFSPHEIKEICLPRSYPQFRQWSHYLVPTLTICNMTNCSNQFPDLITWSSSQSWCNLSQVNLSEYGYHLWNSGSYVSGTAKRWLCRAREKGMDFGQSLSVLMWRMRGLEGKERKGEGHSERVLLFLWLPWLWACRNSRIINIYAVRVLSLAIKTYT